MHKKLLLVSLFFLFEQTAFAAGNTKNETTQDSEISQNEITSTSTSTSTSIDTQHYFEESSFTYTQEAQQKIQQEINNRSTNPGGCPEIHVTELTLQVKPQNEEEWRALDQKFPNIHVLNAPHLRLNQKNITCLVQLFRRLASLDISCNFIGDEGVQALLQNTSWNLQSLTLCHNSIGDLGAHALAANTSWNLENLNLSHNGIKDPGAEALSQNTSWNLKTLNFNFNNIGTEGAKAIATNTAWKELKQLSLMGNVISRGYFEELSKWAQSRMTYVYY